MAKKAAPKAAEPQAAPAPAAKSTAKTAKGAKAAKTTDKADAKTTAAKPATKTEIYTALADKTNLNRKDVAAVFDGLSELIQKEIGKKGPGQFVLPAS